MGHRFRIILKKLEPTLLAQQLCSTMSPRDGPWTTWALYAANKNMKIQEEKKKKKKKKKKEKHVQSFWHSISDVPFPFQATTLFAVVTGHT